MSYLFRNIAGSLFKDLRAGLLWIFAIFEDFDDFEE